MRKVLILAGYDPTGGAGIIRDFITIRDFGAYPFAVITSLTVQNPRGVRKVLERKYEEIKNEVDYLAETVEFDAVKVGMLYSINAVKVLQEILDKDIPVFLDFVLKSKNGHSLLKKDAAKTVMEEIIPKIYFLHANREEAEYLTKMEIKNVYDAVEAGMNIIDSGCKYVSITSGDYEELFDILVGKDITLIYREKKVEKKMHGTGCIFTSAIAAGIVNGKNIKESFKEARKYVRKKIEESVKFCDNCYYLPI